MKVKTLCFKKEGVLCSARAHPACIFTVGTVLPAKRRLTPHHCFWACSHVSTNLTKPPILRFLIQNFSAQSCAIEEVTSISVVTEILYLTVTKYLVYFAYFAVWWYASKLPPYRVVKVKPTMVHHVQIFSYSYSIVMGNFQCETFPSQAELHKSVTRRRCLIHHSIRFYIIYAIIFFELQHWAGSLLLRTRYFFSLSKI